MGSTVLTRGLGLTYVAAMRSLRASVVTCRLHHVGGNIALPGRARDRRTNQQSRRARLALGSERAQSLSAPKIPLAPTPMLRSGDPAQARPVHDERTRGDLALPGTRRRLRTYVLLTRLPPPILVVRPVLGVRVVNQLRDTSKGRVVWLGKGHLSATSRAGCFLCDLPNATASP